MSKETKSTYLGDSVYATDEGMHIRLTTDSHIEADAGNVIYIDSEVLTKLVKFAESLWIKGVE